MKKLFLPLILALSIHLAGAQIKAVTDAGDEVVLLQDGTWKYVNAKPLTDSAISVNPIAFIKNKQASFMVKSKIVNVGVYIDPKVWTFEKSPSSEATEYTFDLKNSNGFAMMVSEKTQVPLTTLGDIALKNAQDAAPDAEIVKKEYRTVNGVKVLCLQMNATVSGIKLTYLGYYYSSDNGAIQLLTYTGQKSFDSEKEILENFLNGFVVVN